MAKQKRSFGSVRAKAGLPAKAGRRRPSHIMKVNGDYVINSSLSGRNQKPNFGIASRERDFDIYDETDNRIRERQFSLAEMKQPKNAFRVLKAKQRLGVFANTVHKNDPFWYARALKDFKMGWISMSDIEKGRV